MTNYHASITEGKNIRQIVISPIFHKNDEPIETKKVKKGTNKIFNQTNAKNRALHQVDFIFIDDFMNSGELMSHLTFTISNKIVSYDALNTCFKKFMRSLRDFFRKDDTKLKYIWVLDLNHSGKVHIHMLINKDFHNMNKFKQKWDKIVSSYYQNIFGEEFEDKISNLNFKKVVSDIHLNNIKYYFFKKIKLTYYCTDLENKTKYGYSRKHKVEKFNIDQDLDYLDVQKYIKSLKETYGKEHIKIDSYIDRVSNELIYRIFITDEK